MRRLAGDEADDLAQEAFLAAWRNLRQWRAEGSFAAWLRQIATRRFLDRRRKVERSNPADPPVAFDPGCTLDQRIAVDSALASLAPRERAAALLVFSEGYSHGEAAKILDVPLGTLKSVVARARARLIPLLEGVAQ